MSIQDIPVENVKKSEKKALIPKKKRREVVTIEGHADISNSFLVLNGEKSIVVDCGSKTMAERISKSIIMHELKLEDVTLIVVTHTHYDHVKGLRELTTKYLPHAKVLIHEKEAKNLETGYSKIPPGIELVNKVASWIGSNLLSFHFNHFPPIDVDSLQIMSGDEFDLDIEEFGYLPGKIIHTPGHSKGSICLFVGRVVVAGDTIECDGQRCFPSFAEDIPVLLESWKKLLDERPIVLLPGHGVRCPNGILRFDLIKYRKVYASEIKKMLAKRIKVEEEEEEVEGEKEIEEEEEEDDL